MIIAFLSVISTIPVVIINTFHNYLNNNMFNNESQRKNTIYYILKHFLYKRPSTFVDGLLLARAELLGIEKFSNINGLWAIGKQIFIL